MVGIYSKQSFLGDWLFKQKGNLCVEILVRTYNNVNACAYSFFPRKKFKLFKKQIRVNVDILLYALIFVQPLKPLLVEPKRKKREKIYGDLNQFLTIIR